MCELLKRAPSLLAMFGVSLVLGAGACSEASSRSGGEAAVLCNEAEVCETPAVGAWDGTYVLSVSPVVAPTRPFLFEAKLTTQLVRGDTSVTLELRPLAAWHDPAKGVVGRQTIVGAPIILGPFPISGGLLTFELAGLVLGREFNPFVSGSGIELDLSFASCLETREGYRTFGGGLCASEVGSGFICGLAGGSLRTPTHFDLTGSTWTLEKVTPGTDYRWTTDPWELPYIDCSRELAGDVPDPPPE